MKKKDEILRIRSIADAHRLLGFDKPKHPLVTVFDAAKYVVPDNMVGVSFATDLYSVALKDGSCGMEYGRNHYDFEEGVMVFTAPNQVMTATREQQEHDVEGWMLLFHPDLVRRSQLGEIIDSYTFFSYDVYEALHLSDEEIKTVTACVSNIRNEYEQRIDNHSQRVIVSNIELLLNYSSRYYERQFNTRTNQNKDIVSQVERYMREYYSYEKLKESGPLSIRYLADRIHLSTNYLSDLLRKETGRSAKDHINDFVVEKAKNLLLSGRESVSEIAYTLGFNYPHYFSRLFKAKTGMTPQEYRELS